MPGRGMRTLYGAYHFASRVLPLQKCLSIVMDQLNEFDRSVGSFSG